MTADSDEVGRFLEIAEIELDQAVNWYRAQVPGLGDAFLIEVLSATDRIARFPTRRIRRSSASSAASAGAQGAHGIACWFSDTDYNEESFFVRHAYFLGANDPYGALRTTLKAEIDEEAWESLHSDTSRPHRGQGDQSSGRRGPQAAI